MGPPPILADRIFGGGWLLVGFPVPLNGLSDFSRPPFSFCVGHGVSVDLGELYILTDKLIYVIGLMVLNVPPA